MRKTREQFLYRPDDPPVSGSPLVGDDPVPEEAPAEEPVQDDPPEDAEPKMTKAEWESANPPRPAPVQRQHGEVELIEGTNLVKPDGYDGWGIDKQMSHISQATVWQAQQSTQAASRVAREIETKADDWFKPYLDEVISTCDPVWLAQATDEQRQGILSLAAGKAVMDGKSPTTSKPVPGASPSSARHSGQNTQSSEVDTVLKGIKDAGYDRVAASPKIRAILEGKAS